MNARLNATTFQALANSSIVPAMGKPADLVVVPTCAGTCMTTYGYIINVFNGVGFTPDSTEVTVLNAATLDMTHFNTVTFPTIANAKCTISRSTGPTTGILVDTHDCDGSTFPDNTADVDQMQSIPALTVDTTGGVALLGTGFPTSSAGTPILGGLGYVKNLGNFSGSGLNLLANRQNFNAVDGRGRIQSTAYMGVEFLPAIGYYIETDLFQVDEISGNKGVCTDANAILKPCLGGTSGSIGGGALLAGACASATVAVTGATTAMAVQASPAGGVDPGAGIYWKARVSSADTVTVDVCAAVGATPSVTTYNVRILQ